MLQQNRPYCFIGNSPRTRHKNQTLRGVLVSAIRPKVAIVIIGVFGVLNPRSGLTQTAAVPAGATLSAQDEASKAKSAMDRGDYEAAFPLLLKHAEQGNASAQAVVGHMYSFGLGVPRDDGKAVIWFKRAAQQGVALAQAELGAHYLYGDGVPTDYTQAWTLLREAVAQGDNEGEYYIGVMYLRGFGVARDYNQALDWFTKAATQGNVIAQSLLGDLYLLGQQIPRDYAKALIWFTKAAAQGNAHAEANLGYIYERGLGVRPNMQVAVEWYKKAAAQGDTDSQEELRKIASEKAEKRREIPEALAFRCKLEVFRKTPSTVLLTETPENEKKVDDTYEACLRSNWHRLFGDTPFPGD